jgi:hypothetical protein
MTSPPLEERLRYAATEMAPDVDLMIRYCPGVFYSTPYVLALQELPREAATELELLRAEAAP